MVEPVKLSHHRVCSPCKIWLLCVIPCGRIQDVLKTFAVLEPHSPWIRILRDPVETHPSPHVIMSNVVGLG